LGQGYRLPVDTESREPLLLVGGGYGVAPLLFLIRQALAAGYPVLMIIGARTDSDLLLVDDFEALDVPLWTTTEDGSVGQRGVVTDAIPRAMAAAGGKVRMVYACGPTAMLEAVARRCQADDIPVQLSWEAHMRCGIGLCGSCEVGPGWLTCLDGPVFPFNPRE
jgi:dihydroorotate dehydrogenase electron transfer subunit